MKLLAGLCGGAVGAIVASLVSLPLESPDDLVFNTFTVTLGALLAGAVMGVLWWALPAGRSRVPLFGALCAAGLAVSTVAAFGFEALVDGAVGFMVPLAALVFACVAVATPLLSEAPWRRSWIAAPVLSAVALAVGVGLMGQGDEESGRLELPAAEPTPASGAAVVTIDDVRGVEFRVVPGESVATYTVREKLASMPTTTEAVGRTTALEGVVRLDGVSTITADLSAFESDQARRDNFVRERIFNQDPIATFTLDPLPDLPAEYREGETVTREVTGELTIRGVTRPQTFQVEARLTGDTLHIVGRTDFTWADFQIDPPNTPLVTVEDNVHIEVLVVARRSEGT
ncbi:MAG TPA: YceI family protein [Dehalococcoidia bacterium]|nr:YceI family protein [Dehalococcoidia bacterium]